MNRNKGIYESLYFAECVRGTIPHTFFVLFIYRRFWACFVVVHHVQLIPRRVFTYYSTANVHTLPTPCRRRSDLLFLAFLSLLGRESKDSGHQSEKLELSFEFRPTAFTY